MYQKAVWHLWLLQNRVQNVALEKLSEKKICKEKKDTLILEFLIRTTLVSSIYSSKLELQGTLILVHHSAN